MTRLYNQSRFDTVLDWLFLALVFSLGFMQPAIIIVGFSVTITDGLFLITGLIWSIALLLRTRNFTYDPAFYIFAFYAAVLLLSTIFSEDPRLSVRKLPAELYLIGLAVLTVNAVNSRKMLRKVVIAWLAASAVTTIAGTITVASYYLGKANFVTDFSMHHYGSLPPGYYPRIQSTFLYPSLLCNYLTVSTMMLLAALNLGWISSRVFGLLALLFAITIAFTLTPGIGGVILAIGVWYWLVPAVHKAVKGRVALAGGTSAAVVFLLVSTFSLLPSPTSPYFFELGAVHLEPTQRLLTWQGAAETFLRQPFFGRGLGLAAASVTFMPPSGQMQLLTDAHNAFLSVAAQAGIFGLTGFVLIVVSVGRRAFSDPKEKLLTALGIAFISALVYQGLVGSFENARHIWVLMGLILAVSRIPIAEANAA